MEPMITKRQPQVIPLELFDTDSMKLGILKFLQARIGGLEIQIETEIEPKTQYYKPVFTTVLLDS